MHNTAFWNKLCPPSASDQLEDPTTVVTLPVEVQPATSNSSQNEPLQGSSREAPTTDELTLDIDSTETPRPISVLEQLLESPSHVDEALTTKCESPPCVTYELETSKVGPHVTLPVIDMTTR